MERLVIIGFLLIGVFGYGQSKRKVNKQLKVEYSLLDAKVDSLSEVYGSAMRIQSELTDSFYVKATRMSEKEQPFTVLIEDVKTSLLKVKMLGLKPIDGVRAAYLDSLILSLLTNTVGQLTSPVRKKEFSTFFGFSKSQLTNVDKYSIKNQNRLLMMMGEQRERESLLILQNTEKALQFNNRIEKADSTLDEMSARMDKLTPEFLVVQSKLKTELDKQREWYAKKGPENFALGYQLVFPDVFPEDNLELVYPNDNQEMNTARVPMIIAGNEDVIAVDEPAEFPGGKYAMLAFMKKYLHYPQVAKELGLEGKCYLQFVVSAAGKISNVKVVRGIPDCSECDQEAARMIRSMPQWAPGKVDGVPVNSLYELTIVFKLDQ